MTLCNTAPPYKIISEDTADWGYVPGPSASVKGEVMGAKFKALTVTVKFRGIEEMLDKMVEYGITETKSDAIRRGDIELRN